MSLNNRGADRGAFAPLQVRTECARCEMSRGVAVQTLHGHSWHPLDPRPEEVYFEDLEALSRVCRFGGHCRVFYSVAEHSVRVCWRVRELGGSEAAQRAALLHDAHEAYPPGDQLGPVLRDVWRRTGGSDPVSIMAAQAFAAVAERFGIAHSRNAALVKRADVELLAIERERILSPARDPSIWGGLQPPPIELRLWSAWSARDFGVDPETAWRWFQAEADRLKVPDINRQIFARFIARAG